MGILGTVCCGGVTVERVAGATRVRVDLMKSKRKVLWDSVKIAFSLLSDMVRGR